MTVYKITNIINSKIYVGITTKELRFRISTYKSMCKNKKDNKHRIVMAMKKYGFDNFIFDILCICDTKEELKIKEIEYIKHFSSCDPQIGYNVSLGGYLPSEETLRKISYSLKGKYLSKEHKEKISKGLMGHSVSDKVKSHARKQGKKIAGWNKGTVGVMKSNKTSFKKGAAAPNKGRKRIINSEGKIKYVLFPF